MREAVSGHGRLRLAPDRAWSRIHLDLKVGVCVHSFRPPNENIHFGLPADATHGRCRVEVQQPPPTALQTFYDARRERRTGFEVAFQSRSLDADRTSRVTLEALSRPPWAGLEENGQSDDHLRCTEC